MPDTGTGSQLCSYDSLFVKKMRTPLPLHPAERVNEVGRFRVVATTGEPTPFPSTPLPLGAVDGESFLSLHAPECLGFNDTTRSGDYTISTRLRVSRLNLSRYGSRPARMFSPRSPWLRRGIRLRPGSPDGHRDPPRAKHPREVLANVLRKGK